MLDHLFQFFRWSYSPKSLDILGNYDAHILMLTVQKQGGRFSLSGVVVRDNSEEKSSKEEQAIGV